MRVVSSASFFAPAKAQCGWFLTAPGRWQRDREVIFRRSPGVWYWYPDGLGGTRAIGPFKTMKGARLRALRGASTRIRGLEDR
jgi:hypothetical protein